MISDEIESLGRKFVVGFFDSTGEEAGQIILQNAEDENQAETLATCLVGTLVALDILKPAPADIVIKELAENESYPSSHVWLYETNRFGNLEDKTLHKKYQTNRYASISVIECIDLDSVTETKSVTLYRFRNTSAKGTREIETGAQKSEAAQTPKKPENFNFALKGEQPSIKESLLQPSRHKSEPTVYTNSSHVFIIFPSKESSETPIPYRGILIPEDLNYSLGVAVARAFSTTMNSFAVKQNRYPMQGFMNLENVMSASTYGIEVYEYVESLQSQQELGEMAYKNSLETNNFLIVSSDRTYKNGINTGTFYRVRQYKPETYHGKTPESEAKPPKQVDKPGLFSKIFK